MKKKFHILYKTTNLINGKYYIGIHSTNDLNDGYLGSGYLLWKAIDKYGSHNFKCEHLKLFKSRSELLRAERIWVNKSFVKSDLNYNVTLGGNAEFPRVREPRTISTRNKLRDARLGMVFSEKWCKAISASKKGKSNPKGAIALKKYYSNKDVLLRSSNKSKELWLDLSYRDKTLKAQSDFRATGYYQSDEFKTKTSVGTKKAYSKPEVYNKYLTNYNNFLQSKRPWDKSNNSLSKVTESRKKFILNCYFNLDKIYEVYIKDTSISKYNLNKELNVFNLEVTNGIISYLEKYGDPKKDSLWVKFKENYERD